MCSRWMCACIRRRRVFVVTLHLMFEQLTLDCDVGFGVVFEANYSHFTALCRMHCIRMRFRRLCLCATWHVHLLRVW